VWGYKRKKEKVKVVCVWGGGGGGGLKINKSRSVHFKRIIRQVLGRFRKIAKSDC